jgi:hypothetical protein
MRDRESFAQKSECIEVWDKARRVLVVGPHPLAEGFEHVHVDTTP